MLKTGRKAVVRWRSRGLLWCLGFLTWLGIPGKVFAQGQTYYVSTTGKDDAAVSGLSEGEAWRTIAYGANRAQPGDVVMVKAGDYGAEQVKFPKGGQAGSMIILRGYGGRPVLSDPTKESTAFNLGKTNFVRIENFLVKGYQYAVLAEDSTNCEIVDVEADSPGGVGIHMSGNVHNYLVDGCIVHGGGWNGIMAFCRDDAGGPCSNITVQNCEVYDQQKHNGIDFHCGVSDSKILNNYVHDFPNMGIFVHSWHVSTIEVSGNRCEAVVRGVWLWNATNCVVKNNVFSNCSQYGILVLSSDEGNGLEQATDNVIQNNLIYGCTSDSWGGYGIRIEGAKGTVFENNTIAGCKQVGVDVKDSEVFGSTETVVGNNIIANNSYGGLAGNQTMFAAISYNDVWNNVRNYQGDLTPGPGDIAADPLFADPGNGDYHLKSKGGRWTKNGWVIDSVHSPGIDAGDPLSPFSNEEDPNGGRINLGAYGNSAQASKSAAQVPCSAREKRACSSDRGECKAGTEECGDDGTWGACSGVSPVPEVCDEKDNDCDGVTDEDSVCGEEESRTEDDATADDGGDGDDGADRGADGADRSKIGGGCSCGVDNASGSCLLLLLGLCFLGALRRLASDRSGRLNPPVAKTGIARRLQGPSGGANQRFGRLFQECTGGAILPTPVKTLFGPTSTAQAVVRAPGFCNSRVNNDGFFSARRSRRCRCPRTRRWGPGRGSC